MRSKSSLDKAASMSAIVPRRSSSGVASFASAAMVISAFEGERLPVWLSRARCLNSLNSGNRSSSRTSTLFSVFAQDLSAPVSDAEMCAPGGLQQLGLGQIRLGPMHAIVEHRLAAARKHLG